jgi:tetratricopeptide (TPR) repeat protein
VIEQLLQADRLLAVDQVDAAEAIYRRVSELDPMDAIAVVGLARCALARGDDRAAHELSARALEIDPANDMARRMEARLSEILITRGETVSRPPSATAVEGLPMRPVTTSPATGAPSAPIQSAKATSPAAPEPRRGILARLRGR